MHSGSHFSLVPRVLTGDFSRPLGVIPSAVIYRDFSADVSACGRFLAFIAPLNVHTEQHAVGTPPTPQAHQQPSSTEEGRAEAGGSSGAPSQTQQDGAGPSSQARPVPGGGGGEQGQQQSVDSVSADLAHMRLGPQPPSEPSVASAGPQSSDGPSNAAAAENARHEPAPEIQPGAAQNSQGPANAGPQQQQQQRVHSQVTIRASEVRIVALDRLGRDALVQRSEPMGISLLTVRFSPTASHVVVGVRGVPPGRSGAHSGMYVCMRLCCHDANRIAAPVDESSVLRCNWVLKLVFFVCTHDPCSKYGRGCPPARGSRTQTPGML